MWVGFLRLSKTNDDILQIVRKKEATYYINTSVLLENTPLVHAKPHPGLGWPIFHILTSKDIDDFSDIMFDPLINCTFICWCMIETSSDLSRKSSPIFGCLW